MLYNNISVTKDRSPHLVYIDVKRYIIWETFQNEFL